MLENTRPYAPFFREIGFKRDEETYERWEILDPDIDSLSSILTGLRVARTTQAATQSTVACVMPANDGKLICDNVEDWVRRQRSKNNRHSGSSWGNYLCQVTFVNHLPYGVKIQWINYGGKERESNHEIPPRTKTTMKTEVNHPHTIRSFQSDALICCYTATSRGRGGHHVVFLGEDDPNVRNQLYTRYLENTPADDRDSGRNLGPPPPPPPPGHRRRWE